MAVVARFYINEITQMVHATKVKMNCVTKGSDENKEFWAATPSGFIELVIKNEAAAAYFKPGQELLVTFEV